MNTLMCALIWFNFYNGDIEIQYFKDYADAEAQASLEIKEHYYEDIFILKEMQKFTYDLLENGVDGVFEPHIKCTCEDVSKVQLVQIKNDDIEIIKEVFILEE